MVQPLSLLVQRDLCLPKKAQVVRSNSFRRLPSCSGFVWPRCYYATLPAASNLRRRARRATRAAEGSALLRLSSHPLGGLERPLAAGERCVPGLPVVCLHWSLLGLGRPGDRVISSDWGSSHGASWWSQPWNQSQYRQDEKFHLLKGLLVGEDRHLLAALLLHVMRDVLQLSFLCPVSREKRKEAVLGAARARAGNCMASATAWP